MQVENDGQLRRMKPQAPSQPRALVQREGSSLGRRYCSSQVRDVQVL